ncbi:hypothetical protein BXZ70DRAFT_902893 [Cristinia sonorae]|uniref:Uncharacterized protein n=1 Tax=Cristinia sonorae TaxID=1940300 RepID=A0A8K0UCJ6_9AGAR|nr:hypothetical protein BXZ70DRAFT_902893 [Cristinia sonorae]
MHYNSTIPHTQLTPAAPVRADIQLHLAQQESGEMLGAAQWIAVGLKIEERQLSLAAEIRKLPPDATPTQRNKLVTAQGHLQARIDAFENKAASFLRGYSAGEEPASKRIAPPITDTYWDRYDEFIIPAPFPPGHLEDASTVAAERQILSLPSNIPGILDAPQMRALVAEELQLRIGQANESIHNLQLGVSQKSFIFRNDTRLATNNRENSRARTKVRVVQHAIEQNARIYGRARRAISILSHENAQILGKYRELTREDLKANTAVWDPNAPGQRNESLTWIWKVNHGSIDDSDWLTELFRVNFLRARARAARASEECTLLQHEMDWTKCYLENEVEIWRSRVSKDSSSPGRNAYAMRQVSQWLDLVDAASNGVEQVKRLLEK